jgi:hemerythrin-like domain-containing protein
MEKRGLHAPLAAIRKEHEEIRRLKYRLLHLAKNVSDMDFSGFAAQLDEVVTALVPLFREHIMKVNNILFPMALYAIDDESVWLRLKEDCDKVGYCCFAMSGNDVTA